MAKRTRAGSLWTTSLRRSATSLARSQLRASTKLAEQMAGIVQERRKVPMGSGQWLSGLAVGPAGGRRYRLFRPAGIGVFERVPLLVMLHGCGQDAAAFARGTRMNQVATRQRFLVLYPEQDRRANLQGCWNWYDTDSHRAFHEAATLRMAIDQVCLLYPVDPERIAVAGLSAGASMSALLATRYPERFRAVVMHSGIPPGAAHSSLTALGAMRGRRAPFSPSAAFAPSALHGPHLPRVPQAESVWPSLLVIHGRADATVAPGNGAAAARLWADQANALAGKTRQVQRGGRYSMDLTDFKRSGRTVATLCEVDRLGHAWSGGDNSERFNDSRGPDASRMIWTFAERQFRAVGR